MVNDGWFADNSRRKEMIIITNKSRDVKCFSINTGLFSFKDSQFMRLTASLGFEA